MAQRTRALVLAVALVAPLVAAQPVAAQDESPSTTAPALLIEGTAPTTSAPATTTTTVVPSAAAAGDEEGDSTSTRLWVAVGLLVLLSVVVAWLTVTYWRVTRPPGRAERAVVDLDELVGPARRR